jgi:hypothetical protein
MPTPELHTIELSRDKPRLTGPRLSDVGTVDTADERSRNHKADGTFAPRNEAAKGRRAKMALTRDVRMARRRCEDALRDAVEPSEADRLIADAEALYREAKRDVGHTSIVVVSPALTFAINTVLAGYYMNATAKAGFATKEGERLLSLAHACEQHAQRAMTAMLAAAKALGSGKPPVDPHKAAFDAFGAPPNGVP